MNVQTFGESAISSAAGSLIFALAAAAAATVWVRLSSKVLLARLSLRTRITIGIVGAAVMALLAIWLGANSYATLAGFTLVLVLMIHYILSELSQVGILNAFSSTARGISATASLERVRREIWFLGIGAKKLTDSAEFEAALRRCRANGGSVRFLLSSPSNPSLEKIAKNNQRDSLAYSLRVTESIREIVNKAKLAGVDYEIRLYKLEQELALPHFRLMFIDDSVCLFSHLVWNDSEGLDNPQLVLRRSESKMPNSLYRAFRTYYDDLWNSGAVTPATEDPVIGIG